MDLYIMVWAWIMFFALDLDRANISQANTDNFLQDLGMTTNDFNTGNMLFKVCSLYKARYRETSFDMRFPFVDLLLDRRASFTANLEESWSRCLDSQPGV